MVNRKIRIAAPKAIDKRNARERNIKTAQDLGYTITDEEMYKTFNMGWGFGIIVDKTDIDKAMNTIEQNNVNPEIIGKVTDKQKVEIQYQNKHMILT
jgi:phosphoribosylformylglycinamidine cyclo-ligase